MMRHLPLIIAVIPCLALGQEASRLDRAQEQPMKEAYAAAAGAGIDVELSKTAYVDGEDVCGEIRIRNRSGQSATPTSIVDSLEVHFPRGVRPQSLPSGSTANWHKVADVPIGLPGTIAAGQTATIAYCFSLCLSADYAGANSMRNVVSVTVVSASGSSRTFTTRSVSFPPPTLDCKACCLPDGSCRDTITANCAAAGGLAHGADTECATVQCIQACCLGDGACRDATVSACAADGGDALGLGTTCSTANTTCRGACCFFKGCRDDATSGDCRGSGATYLGHDTACESQLEACPAGACCYDACEDAESGGYHQGQAWCEQGGGTYLGDGATCATANTNCLGACCFFKGCLDGVREGHCRDVMGATFLGRDTQCINQLAACPTGACCYDGTCEDAESGGYHQSQVWCGQGEGTYLGDGTSCATSDCPRPCCFNDGTCSDLSRGTCLTSGGHPLRPELTPTSCEQLDVVGGCPQACCFGGGHCENTVPLECSLRGGALQGPGSSCGGLGCPRGCCHDDGSCSELPVSVCQAGGGRPQTIHDENGNHVGIDCTEVEDRGGCAVPCCFPNPGSNYCNTIPPDECTSLGGFPRPVSLNCGSADLCDGACCIRGGCEIMSVQDCTEQGGDPQTPGTDCGFGPISPCSVISP